MPPERRRIAIARLGTFDRERLSLLASTVVATLVIWALTLLDASEPFERYLGPIPAALLVPLAGGLAAVALVRIEALAALPQGAPASTWWSVAACVFCVPMIVLDVVSPFPPDINVRWPLSLAFYPVIAFVAEVGFHLVPLAALLTALRRRLEGEHRSQVIRACIVVSALVEPTYQIVMAVGDQPTWAETLVWLHIAGFNLFELYVFRRSGFSSTLKMRLYYYLCWHILWGAARLDAVSFST